MKLNKEVVRCWSAKINAGDLSLEVQWIDTPVSLRAGGGK